MEKKELKEQAERATRKSVGAFLRFTATVLLFLLVFWVFFEVFNAKRQNKSPTFFGYSFSIVITGSMEPDIRVGELLIVRETAPESIEVGDDILFVGQSGAVQGMHIVHRVVEKGTDEAGLYFRTKGTNNPVADTDVVRASGFLGKAVAHSVFWGKIFGFLADTKSLMMIAVLVLIVPFIIRQIVKIIRIAKSPEPEDPGRTEQLENQSPPKGKD